MKTQLSLVVLVFSLISACDDTAANNNNVNNTNNLNNTNNNLPPDFMDYPARVVSVSDGDTFYVRWLDKTVKIRLKGVNTPEIAHSGVPAEPFGVAAMDFTIDHLPQSSWVGLEFDDPQCAWETPPASCYDVYDRLLAYAVTELNQDLGAQLLVNGLAEVYTSAIFNRKTLYLQYQQSAIDAGLGIWSK
ncbi:thermonuclease family protein [Myxococcota bacterium]|nr:thermonuclease family protein [Myxococcota bacterium]MBU1534494.1 thermonuclease family protein [Myxococcota bacterium]